MDKLMKVAGISFAWSIFLSILLLCFNSYIFERTDIAIIVGVGSIFIGILSYFFGYLSLYFYRISKIRSKKLGKSKQ